jgi:uncharacterized pyridoxamine 5'-phosphate oxidase family protein
MNGIKYLEFQRLLRELQFVESDYLYQSEVLKLSDSEFLKNVDVILNQFPELKEIYIRRQDEIFKSIITKPSIESFEETQKLLPESTEVKKLYRDIVKTTHPDKIKNHKLNELYLEATQAYENNDLITLYKVCSELNIDFDLPDNYVDELGSKIQSLKRQISFLESTFTFKWIKSTTQDDKNRVVIEFIRSKIS